MKKEELLAKPIYTLYYYVKENDDFSAERKFTSLHYLLEYKWQLDKTICSKCKILYGEHKYLIKEIIERFIEIEEIDNYKKESIYTSSQNSKQ